jgi:hypothetical protein
VEELKMIQIEIKSRPGVFITLDKEVAEKIGHWGWYIGTDKYVYARLPGSGRKNKKDVKCSRAVIWAVTGEWPPVGSEVDHIHHRILDNRFNELRVTNASGNRRNQLTRKGCKYQGVGFDKRKGTWRGHVCLFEEGKDKQIIASVTKDEDTAARARDCIAHKIGGFLMYNFPDETFEEKWRIIGDKQRTQILHSLEKNGIKTEV